MGLLFLPGIPTYPPVLGAIRKTRSKGKRLILEKAARKGTFFQIFQAGIQDVYKLRNILI